MREEASADFLCARATQLTAQLCRARKHLDIARQVVLDDFEGSRAEQVCEQGA
jgi:hypothetical protein